MLSDVNENTHQAKSILIELEGITRHEELYPLPIDLLGPTSRYYKYENLKSKSHIRLLKINRITSKIDSVASEYPKLSYEIVQVDLNECPTYSAVSYVWGAPIKSHFIRLTQDYDFLITESLRRALLPLAKWSTGYLWIDQVCIDQKNIRERGHQVGIMGDIYLGAQEVLIWTDECIEGIGDLNRNIWNERSYSALNKLLLHSWFQRAWVVQEAILAQEAYFVTGDQAVCLTDVEKFATFCVNHGFDAGSGAKLPLPRAGQQRLRLIKTLSSMLEDERILQQKRRRARLKVQTERSRRGRREVSLAELVNVDTLKSSSTFIPDLDLSFGAILNDLWGQASEPHDHIFAYAYLASLSRPRISILPDYSLPAIDLFINTTRSIISALGTLDIFRFVDHRRPAHRRRTRFSTNNKVAALLPSWVPDWSCGGKFSGFKNLSLLSGSVDRERPFVADKGYRVRSSTTRPWNENEAVERRLRMAGKIVNHVGNAVAELLEFIEHLRDTTTTEFPFLPNDNKSTADLLQDGAMPTASVGLGQDSTCLRVSNQNSRECLLRTILAGLVTTRASLSVIQVTPQVFLGEYNKYPQMLLSPDTPFMERIKYLEPHFSLFQTNDLAPLLAPRSALPGDVVAVLHGSDVPVILREMSDGTYSLLGQCFLDGVMYGEAVTWEEEDADEFLLS